MAHIENPDWRPARIVENRCVARGTYWITLEAADEKPAAYQPGHVLGLRLNRDGAEPLRHAYTVSWGEPDKRRFSHLYRVILDGRMTPLMGELEPGAALDFHGPVHTPIVDEVDKKAKRIFGIATGTGLGPLYGYALQALAAGESRPVTLYTGMRARADLCFDAELKALAAKHSNLSHAYTLTKPDAAWRAAGGLTGRVDDALPPLLKQAGRLGEAHYHLVGNGAMVRLWRAALKSAGVPEKRVSVETFFNHRVEPTPSQIRSLAAKLGAK